MGDNMLTVDEWLEWLESEKDEKIWNINSIQKCDGFSDKMKKMLTSLCKPLFHLFKESKCHGKLSTECRFNKSNSKFFIGDTFTQFTKDTESEFMEAQRSDIKFVKEVVLKLITKYPAPEHNAETTLNLTIIHLFLSMCDEAIDSQKLHTARYFGIFALMNPLFLDDCANLWFAMKGYTLRKSMKQEFDEELEKLCTSRGYNGKFNKYMEEVEKYKEKVSPLYEVSKLPDEFTGIVITDWVFLGQILELYVKDRFDGPAISKSSRMETDMKKHKRCWLVLGEGFAALWYFMALLCSTENGYSWCPYYNLETYLESMVYEAPYIWE